MQRNHSREYAACAATGMTMDQTAAHLRVSRTAVYKWAKRHGATFQTGSKVQNKSRAEDDRILTVLALRAEGRSAGTTGRWLGMTRSAVLGTIHRIIKADKAESGEPAEIVMAGYR